MSTLDSIERTIARFYSAIMRSNRPMEGIYQGHAESVLKTLPSSSIQTCVTSPPYYGLRDYGMEGQIGLEETPEAYTQRLVEVFREVRRVLRVDGTVWLNLGDSYAGSWGNYGGKNRGAGHQRIVRNGSTVPNPAYEGHENWRPPTSGKMGGGIKPKNLIGIPWRVAFALQSDGWYLRQDIIWHKPNPMPESVLDRCTKAHEYIFLISKSPTYYFDADAIKTPWANRPRDMQRSIDGGSKHDGKHAAGYNGHTTSGGVIGDVRNGANKRSVWTVPTQPYKGAHFATFPPALIEPCILAGARSGDTVLDPFLGSGTTAAVAKSLARKYVGIELNPQYINLAQERLAKVQMSLLHAGAPAEPAALS